MDQMLYNLLLEAADTKVEYLSSFTGTPAGAKVAADYVEETYPQIMESTYIHNALVEKCGKRDIYHAWSDDNVLWDGSYNVAEELKNRIDPSRCGIYRVM